MWALALALLLLVPCAPAQQPDIRVGILSLYRLSQLTVVYNAPAPPQKALKRRGRKEVLTVAPSPASSGTRRELAVSAVGELVRAGEEITPRLVIQGEFQITGPQIRVQDLRFPLEISARGGHLRAILRLPVEEYVAAVVQGETAGLMPPEALKAMAVAARSYATRFRERHKRQGFDFCDTTHCQYLQLDVKPVVRAAVQETSGELLWDHGTPLAAYYHKDCGGRTESAAAVWPDQRSSFLSAHEDPYCRRSAPPGLDGSSQASAGGRPADSGTGAWRSEIARADLERALATAGFKLPRGWKRISIVERTPAGRARTLRFYPAIGHWPLALGSQPAANGQGPTAFSLSASSLRFAVGRALGWNTLKSDWYEVSSVGAEKGDAGTVYVFSGRGVGHGVGLCQAGAAEMAREGRDYREILDFYYAHAPIGRSAQGIPWKTLHTQKFDLTAVKSSDAAMVLPAARSALEWAQAQTGLALRARPVLEVFPTVAMFRDATGEPGWVAASTHSSNKQQATSNEQQASSNKQQATSNEQQASSNKQQASSNKQQASGNKQQASRSTAEVDGPRGSGLLPEACCWKLQLQPPAALKGRLGAVLRHEFLHLLIESNCREGTPLWFREGLAVYLSGDPAPVESSLTPAQIDEAIESRRSEGELRRVYAAAAARVRKLEQQYGRTSLIEWVREGMPGARSQ
jgi:stage II sporulation protein D